jgi:NAD+ kinase
MKIKTIGLIVAEHRAPAVNLAAQAADWLIDHKIGVLLPPDIAARLGRRFLGAEPAEFPSRCDLLISLGGDGSLLAAARLAAPAGKLLLGVHLGGFGFLAEVPQAQFFPALEATLKGKFQVQERMMLEVKVKSAGSTKAKWLDFALNEVLVGHGGLPRPFAINTLVGGHALSTFSSDGLIVATPTGSTAYSLSAGGPIVDPQTRLIILTPICAHTLSARPLVAPADQEIEVSVGPLRRPQEIRLTVDGQRGTLLEENDRVLVRQAPYTARLVCFTDPRQGQLCLGGFHEKLRNKLGWGRRRR